LVLKERNFTKKLTIYKKQKSGYGYGDKMGV